MAEEFKNPQRDFKLSIAISALFTGLLYVLTSIATIGTAIYVNQSLYAPVALMFSRSLGVSAAAITLFLALTTCFGTMNAYSVGVSRLVYALARDRSMPTPLSALNNRNAPARALILLFTGSAMSLSIDAFLGAKLGQLFLLSGAGFMALYILGSASAVKLLKLRGVLRVFPYITLLVSIIVFAFVGEYVLFPILISIVALLWTWRRHFG